MPSPVDAAAAGRALGAHLAVDPAERQAKWRHAFYDLVEQARFHERDPRITPGSDGFPYFALDIASAKRTDGTIEFAPIAHLATARGFGITVHAADPSSAPWTFRCGDLVSKRAYGSFELPRIGMPLGGIPVIRDVRRNAREISVGAPPATLLPGFVQPLLRRFFERKLGIPSPAALALLVPQAEPPEQLVFRMSRADFARSRDLQAALAGLSWFLPRHTVVSVLEPEVVAELARVFVPLSG